MDVNFQQNRGSRSVTTVHVNVFAKIAICINLQLPIIVLKKMIISDMHHRVRYMYINFQQNRSSKSVKTVKTNVFAKIASCINLQLPIIILKKMIISNMHHRVTYMYISFHQNRTSRSVKTVRTIIFSKNLKLHKFATGRSN